MIKIANNNQDIISNIIKTISNNSSANNNVINRFFNKNNISANNIFPNISYKTNIEDIYSSDINMPINKFKDVINKEEEYSTEQGDDFIMFNNLGNQIMLSEKDVKMKNILGLTDVIRQNTNSGMLEFQSLIDNIVKYTENYKAELKNINGKDFETLVTLLSQGQDIKNILNSKYIPYDQIANKANAKFSDNVIIAFLKRKLVKKDLYYHFKKFYSPVNKNKTLYDTYNLDDKNIELYVENISTYGGLGHTKENKLTSPKTDMKIIFFTIDNRIPLSSAYENRKIYNNDSLNVSIKQDTFVGYQTISVNLSKVDHIDEGSIISQIKNITNSMISNNAISTSISNDCVFKLKQMSKGIKQMNDIYSNLRSIKIIITPNESGSMKNYIGDTQKNFSYYAASDKRLGDFDSSKNKKYIIKFLYGNFIDISSNANSMLHVKNKSNINSINNVLPLLEPISVFDEDIIRKISNLSVVYIYSLKKLKLMNINCEYNNYDYNQLKSNSIVIFNSKNDFKTNISFDSYLFKSKKSIDIFVDCIFEKISYIVRMKPSETTYNAVINSVRQYGEKMLISQFIDTISKKIINAKKVYKATTKQGGK